MHLTSGRFTAGIVDAFEAGVVETRSLAPVVFAGRRQEGNGCRGNTNRMPLQQNLQHGYRMHLHPFPRVLPAKQYPSETFARMTVWWPCCLARR
jgi:hypothetical protein